MNRLLSELRRRNVFRVAATYLVVAWLLMQFAALIETGLGLPAWFDAMIIALLTLGFPIAVVFAWAFEMTPDGMKLTGPADEAVETPPIRMGDYALMGLLVAGLFVAGFQIATRAPSTGAVITADVEDNAALDQSVSVAVLPFVDMSEARDHAFFSDGISEEILNVLVRIPGLDVAGRTSSFAFKNQETDLREIGETLGVSHVLEGSVRRSDDHLRISAQLVRSSDGFQLWSETFDRELMDIFDVQDEIAQAVADELAVSLGLTLESQPIERTVNIEAYDLYLRARYWFLSFGASKRSMAITYLNDALAQDPDYAPAWATLAGLYSVFEIYRPDSNMAPAWRSAGRAAARRAIELDPNSAEAYVYLGVLQAYAKDWVGAFDSFDLALSLEPNNPLVLNVVAQRYADAGYGEDAANFAERAIRIDPLVPVYWNTLGWSRIATPGADLSQTLAPLRYGIELDPTMDFIYTNAIHEMIAYGQREEAQALLEEGIENRALKGEIADDLTRLFDAWAGGLEAVRLIARELVPAARVDAAIALGDMDLFLLALQDIWAEAPRNDLRLFWTFPDDYRNDQRWKDQATNDGLLTLWQARGFPTGCEAVGEDDFQCQADLVQ